MPSRKTVLDKYGQDLSFTNQEGKIVSLIKTQEVMALQKDFLKNPDTDWDKKIDQIWASFSK